MGLEHSSGQLAVSGSIPGAAGKGFLAIKEQLVGVSGCMVGDIG